MKSRNELIQQLNRAEQERGNLTVLFTNAITQQIGLSATEFECLDCIAHNQPITAGQLASLTGISTGGITGVVDRLAEAGYVKRRQDAADRRRVLLEPQMDERTIKRLLALYDPLAREFEIACQDFSAEELETILRYQTRSIGIIRKLLHYPTPKNNGRELSA